MTKHRPTQAHSQTMSRRTLMLGCAGAALAASMLMPQAAHGQAIDGQIAPGGGGSVFRAPGPTPGTERVVVETRSAVINWARPRASVGDPWVFLPAGNTVTFTSPFDNFAVLNRILPVNGEVVRIDGNVVSRLSDANFTPTDIRTGTVAFYTPNGLLIGGTARFDVGSLVLTTLDIGFAPDGTFIDAAGTINFQNAPNPNSYVTTLAGSRIDAPNDTSFVIFAAPQVTHGGIVRVNGSAAYVAAASAIIRHDAGAFDILITDGTTVANALTHTGTTGGPASTGATDQHRIVMTAVSENLAINALVGGSVGYDDPISASVENGTIVLTAVALGSPPSGAARANLNIVDGAFTSDVTAASTHDVSATGNITFTQDLIMQGARSALLAAGAGQLIGVGGDLAMNSDPPLDTGSEVDRAGGDVRIRATGGGRVQVAGSAQLDASGIGRFSESGAMGDGTGGTAAVEADNGVVTIGGNLELLADGRTALTEATPDSGGLGTGGAVLLSAANGGRIGVGGSLTASASGQGGRSVGSVTQPGNAGTGGTATIRSGTGGRISVAGTSSVQAVGLGGSVFGTDAAAGAGAGGTVRVEANGGEVMLTGPASLQASGGGGQGPRGGAGLGGAIAVQASGGGAVRMPGGAQLEAVGVGGAAAFQAGGTGGSGRGGGISVRAIGGAAGGTITGGNLTTTAVGIGGGGTSGLSGPSPVAPGGGGNGGGGEIEITADADSGRLQVGQLRADAGGFGGAGGSPATATSIPGAGGNATGGTVMAGTVPGRAPGSAGVLTASLADLRANAAGGAGGTAGSALGGTAALRSVGGSTTIADSVGINALAAGGAGRTGGSAQGGTAEIDAVGGSVAIAGTVNVGAAGAGGATPANGSAAGNGAGGTARIATSGAGTALQLSGPAIVQSNGLGGASQSATPIGAQQGGSGTGGNVLVQVTNGARLSAPAISLSANGAGGHAGVGGAGTGGTTRLETAGANSSVALTGSITMSANGGGGAGATGGAGRGGAAQLAVSGGQFTAGGGVRLNSSASGGEGTSRGGDAVAGSSRADAGAPVQVGSLVLQSNAAGGLATGAGGRGGNGQGGLASAAVTTGGSLDAGASGANALEAVGLGGGGATPGSGIGGTVDVRVAAGGRLTFTNATTLAATAGPVGGSGNSAVTATGGTIQVEANGATTFGSLTADADAELAGQGAGGRIVMGGTSPIHFQSATLTARGLGSAPAAGGIALANMAGGPGGSTLSADTDGPLSAANVSATGAVTLATTAGALNANGLSAGSADLSTASGNLAAANVSTSGAASLISGSGTVSATNLTAGGAATLRSTTGAVTANGVTAASLAATAGTSLTASIVAATGNADLVAGGELTGSGISAGQALTATSTGGNLALASASAGTAITAATPGTATLAGTVRAPAITIDSGDIAIQSNAAVGQSGGTVALNVRPGRQAVIGGAAQGPGYTLDAAEANRIRAASLTVAVPAGGTDPNRAPELLVRDVTLDGGNLTSLRLTNPGIVQVEGALTLANAGANHSITIDGGSPAQRVQLLTPGGGVRLRDSAGAPAGTLIIEARDIWVGDAALISRLLADRNFAGRNQSLLSPSGTQAPLGYLQGHDVVLRPASSLFIQNSGSIRAFGGITVGHSLTIQAGSSVGPADVYAFGRRAGPGGEVSGTPFFFEVNFQGLYTGQSEFNTCIINPRICPSSLPGFPGDDIEEPVDGDDASGTPGRIPPSFTAGELINEAALSEPLIEEPVTSGGDSSAWTGDADDEDDEEEEEEEQADPPVVTTPATTPGGGRR